MKLPPDFLHNIQNAFGEAGRRWLAELPCLLEEAAQKWGLTLGEPLLLSYNYFNILSSERGWLVIDPKGVIGPPGCEVGPLLTNPIPDWPCRPESKRQTQRRIAILSERLGWARQVIRDWGVCHCLLSAWWDLTPEDTGIEYALACAELL